MDKPKTAISLNEIEFLKDKFRDFIQIYMQYEMPVIVEIGRYYGFSTFELADVVYPKRGVVISIDTGVGDKFTGYELTNDTFTLLLYQQPESIQSVIFPIISDSTKALVNMMKLGVQARMFFIDGDHSKEQVEKDFFHCLQIMKTGLNIVAFHDYGRFDGVTNTVDNIENIFNGNYKVIERISKETMCILYINV